MSDEFARAEQAGDPHTAGHDHDPSCEVAHGAATSTPSPDDAGDRVLVAVYDTPLASYLLRWGAELGFRTVLLDPDVSDPDDRGHGPDVEVDATTDIVITDHHRDDLGGVMAPLVAAQPRWIGIIGSPRHTGSHVAALRAAGVSDDLIATVRRPIGVDIGSKTPPEIALSILAGLLADRNGRDGGLPAAVDLAGTTA